MLEIQLIHRRFVKLALDFTLIYHLLRTIRPLRPHFLPTKIIINRTVGKLWLIMQHCLSLAL